MFACVSYPDFYNFIINVVFWVMCVVCNVQEIVFCNRPSKVVKLGGWQGYIKKGSIELI